MAEELDDIAEEEPEGKATKRKPPAKEKKEIEEKEPSAPHAKPAPDEKPGRKAKGKKKKGGKFLLIFIIVLVLLILIAAFCVVVYLNWWGMGDIVLNPIRDWLVGVVVWLDPEFRSVDRELRAAHDEREKELDKVEEELRTREVEVTAREEAAMTREGQLDRRSVALNKQEEQIVQAVQIPAFQRELTAQELSDMQSLSRMYAQMPPEAAAFVMFEMYRPEDIATIIYFMNERNAAAILAELDPMIAALITEFLIDPVFAADKYEKMKSEYDALRDSIITVVEETVEENTEE